MGFSFNPPLWFVCGSCKEIFPSTEELKDHKLKQHLGDCLGIKCIIFEEKRGEDAWDFLNPHFSARALTNQQLLPQKRSNVQKRNQVQRFLNPYVALRRLSDTTTTIISTRKRKTTSAQRPPKLPGKSVASKSKRYKSSVIDKKETCQNEALKFPRPMPIPILLPKDEPDEDEETELPLEGVTAAPISSFLSSSSTPNEIPHSDCSLKELGDTELIIANVTSTPNGTKVEFGPYPFQSDQSEAWLSIDMEEEKIEDDKELDDNWGFECGSVDQNDSLPEVEDFNPPAISSTPLTPLELAPEPVFTAESKKQHEPQPESEPEQDSHSEYEPTTVSGSDSEEKSNSDSESMAKKIPAADPSSPTVKVVTKMKSKANLARYRTRRMQSTKKKKHEKEKSSSHYACKTCPATFEIKWQLRKHQRAHPVSKPYRCKYPQCPMAYSTKKGLGLHKLWHKPRLGYLRKENPSENSSPHPDLDIDLNLDLSLLQWLVLQEETNPSNIILLEPDLKSSDVFEPVSEANPVKCKLCEEYFASEFDLRWHVSKCFLFNKLHHSYCLECNRNWSSAFHLRTHKKIKHSTKHMETETQAFFTCSICSKKFFKEHILKLHQAMHNQTDESLTSLSEFLTIEFVTPAQPVVADVDISLSQWLLLQKETNPSNVILLEPDPTAVSDFDVLPISNTNTVQCKLCEKSLTSESLLKNHVSNCFLFNKKNHVFCLICKKHVKKLSAHIEFMHAISGERGSYNCNECSEIFKTKWQLRAHKGRHRRARLGSFGNEKTKSLPTSFACESCPEIFKSKRELCKHRKIHPIKKPFKCTDQHCAQAFQTKKGLRIHKLRHEKSRGKQDKETPQGETQSENSFLVPEIDLQLDLPLLQWLVREENNSPSNFILLEPDPRFSNEFQPPSEANPIKCKLCEQIFETDLDLRMHVSKCFLFNKEYHRYCLECGRTFFNSRLLRSHTKHMHLSRTTFKCSFCPKEFLHLASFKFHEALHKLPEESAPDLPSVTNQDKVQEQNDAEDTNTSKETCYFRCRFCDKPLMNKKCLEIHERGHTGECPYKCPFENCGKAYRSQAHLWKHRTTKHMDDLKLPGHLCTTCGKKFPTACSLKKHIHLMHTDSRPFKCTYDETCSMTFKLKVQLNAHIIQTHTGKKPFQCDQCGKSLIRKATLERHIKLTHEGFRPPKVTCSLCPRMFKGNFELKKHMKTHEGGKSFKCQFCDFVCAGLTYLRRHENLHGKKGNDSDEDNGLDTT